MKTINSEIAEKLREMRLPVFASEFERQCLEPSDQEDSFEVRLKRLVDMEYDSRTNNTIQKNIKMAKFYDSNANINDVDYRPERNIDRGTIESLSTNERIEHHNRWSIRMWKDMAWMCIRSTCLYGKI